jgi:RNA polymerase sigma-70 factor, ECF subfamily
VNTANGGRHSGVFDFVGIPGVRRSDTTSERARLRKNDTEGESYPISDVTDAVLMQRVTARNEPSFAEVFRRYAPAVLGLGRTVLRDASLAEDMVQSVFLGLWLVPERFDAKRGTLRSFLLTQCHGKCVDLIRSRNARSAREAKDFGLTRDFASPVDESILSEGASTEVRFALARLSQTERDVIEMAFYGGHTYRRVAELLGLPEGTVKARIRSGLTHLHRTLCEYDDL